MIANQKVIRDHLDHLRLLNHRPATSQARRQVLTQLATYLGGPLLSASREDLERWQTQLAVGVSSRQTYTNHVRSFYVWAHFYDLIDSDPSSRLIRTRIPKRLPRPIPEVELALAIRCADDRMRAWLVLAAYAGLRAGEIARLRREQVQDHETPTLITILDGKGGKDRIVPVGRRVAEALRPHLQTRGPLWRTRFNNPFIPNQVTQMVSAHFASLGLPYTAHNCRHRFGTRLYQLSGDLRMTGDLMGHSSPVTTAMYTAWAPKVAVMAIEQLDEFLAPGGVPV